MNAIEGSPQKYGREDGIVAMEWVCIKLKLMGEIPGKITVPLGAGVLRPRLSVYASANFKFHVVYAFFISLLQILLEHVLGFRTVKHRPATKNNFMGVWSGPDAFLLLSNPALASCGPQILSRLVKMEDFRNDKFNPRRKMRDMCSYSSRDLIVFCWRVTVSAATQMDRLF